MKSPTPIKLAYCQGVELTPEFTEWFIEKGHIVYDITDEQWRDLTPDIILGPHVYNHQGPLEKKHFDLYTKSMRATMRETKKLIKEKGGGK